MTVLRGWGLPEQHLALDALVAFVDGELSPSAYDRAAAHLARCPACAADAAAQRQARAEVRSAETPSISPQLLRALRSIPSDADLPGQPDELALTEDGQLVTVARRDRAGALGGSARLGSSTPLGGAQSFARATPLGGETPDTSQPRQNRVGYGRRTRQGASVVFSGLVLGALAFMNVPTDEEQEPASPPPPPFLGQAPGEAAIPASAAQTAAPQTPAAPTLAAHPQVASSTEVLPAVDTRSRSQH
jgi:anti-sigma factor RsiW